MKTGIRSVALASIRTKPDAVALLRKHYGKKLNLQKRVHDGEVELALGIPSGLFRVLVGMGLGPQTSQEDDGLYYFLLHDVAEWLARRRGMEELSLPAAALCEFFEAMQRSPLRDFGRTTFYN